MSHTTSFKSLLTGVLLLTTSLSASVTLAQTTQDPTPLTVGVYPTRQVDKFCLAVEKQPNTVASVQLMTSGGNVLYAASLPKKEARFRQIFDMNELQDGTYTIRIEQGDSVIVKSVQLRTTAPEPSQPTRSLTVGK
ncbi:hypothetical protein [Spirosoma arcticum]